MASRWNRRRFLEAGALTLGTILLPMRSSLADLLSAPVARRYDLWAMGGWNHLLIEADSSDAAQAAARAATDAIRGIDRLFSVFDERSILSRINHSDRTDLSLDEPLVMESLNRSLSQAKSTEGIFDPTVEPLMHRWGFRSPEQEVSCVRLMKGRDWNYQMVECDFANARFRRESKLVMLDSGGWAKGLAAERAALAALSAGATLAQVSCGGDIFRAQSGEANFWDCGIRDPLQGRSDVALTVRQNFSTVATSGNYETFRTDSLGRKVSHLMDPRTGGPSESDLLSVTVFGNDGLAVDAVASALFVMGSVGATAWLTSHTGFAGVLIDRGSSERDLSISLIGDLKRVC